jgi:hypothetical protein
MVSLEDGRNHAADADEQSFWSDPVAYFGSSYTKMHSMPRHHVEELQQRALSIRFQQQREEIPMLDKLATTQGIKAVTGFDEAFPLFFEQAIYKSYPLSLLVNNRFDQLTTWLNKLTSSNLSRVSAAGCVSIDGWLDLLNQETDLDPLAAPTATGAMQFLPRNKRDWDLQMRSFRIGNLQRFGAEPTKRDLVDPVHTLWPTYADGHVAQFRIGRYAFKYFSLDRKEYCHAAYPGAGSSDLMFLAARMRAAATKGDGTKVEVPKALLARRGELEEQQRNMPERQTQFIEELVGKLAGERVFTASTWTFYYDIAKKGLARGQSCRFAPDSVLQTGGGAKGLVVPDDWEQVIKEFFGVDKLIMGYGMTEVTATNWLCEYNCYHLQPWLIPYLIDPASNMLLPRKGWQSGRLALFDIAMTGHWGGIVSPDLVELNFDWDCPCGRKSPHLSRDIQYVGGAQGGSDKITCAATPEAQATAMEFLLGS